MTRRGYEALWLWFGLSRSAFATLPRVLMHEMPDDWQADMARLLNQFDEVFPKVLVGLGAEPRKPEVKEEAGRSPFAWFSKKKDDDDE